MRRSDVTEAMRNAEAQAAAAQAAAAQAAAAQAAAELEAQSVMAVGWAAVALECELLAAAMRERGAPADRIRADHILAEGLEARARLAALLGEGEDLPGAALVERALERRREALR